MIDINNELFTAIATVLRATFDGIFVSNEYVRQPPRFPAVNIEVMDNNVLRSGSDSGDIENYAEVMYQVDIYSNLNKGKRAQCWEIANAVDEQFARFNFTRTFMNPVQNMNDATIYRLTGRYRAVVGKDQTIYQR